MDFDIGLPVSTNWKGEIYDSIFVIIDLITKIVHYKPVKLTINTSGLVKVTINILVWYHGLLNSIATDRYTLLTLKFGSLLCYFLGIKLRLSIAYHPQTDGQTEKQNSIIEALL